jgi:hypothetical protein
MFIALICIVVWVGTLGVAYRIGWKDAKDDERFKNDINRMVAWSQRGIQAMIEERQNLRP